MERVVLDMAMSLGGFITGPNGERDGLHDWVFPPSGDVRAGDAAVIEDPSMLRARS